MGCDNMSYKITLTEPDMSCIIVPKGTERGFYIYSLNKHIGYTKGTLKYGSENT